VADQPIRIAIAGAAGRMGRRLYALAHPDDRFDVVVALEATGHPSIGADAGETAGVGRTRLPIQERSDTPFDVLVDFSTPAGTIDWLDLCAQRKHAIVIGTTGHSEEQLDTIRRAAARIPVLKAANMSLGVNLLFRLAAQAAKAVGDAYDIEIVETHHRFKKDAPSGTALALLQAVLDATGCDKDHDVVFGRHGQTGQRRKCEIGVHALRIGDTVGEHEVHLGTLGETITLKHTAHTRDTFANGALRAAAWIVGRPPDFYTMFDVLGL
jgi:4-hydroxy-tetrahydrodipicolinate reductase